MITVQAEIVTIADRAAMATAAEILLVSAATTDDPASRRAVRRQTEIIDRPSGHLFPDALGVRATKARRRVGIRSLSLSGEFPGSCACLLMFCPSVLVVVTLGSVIRLVRLVRWGRGRLHS